jgi:hypothetical protein
MHDGGQKLVQSPHQAVASQRILHLLQAGEVVRDLPKTGVWQQASPSCSAAAALGAAGAHFVMATTLHRGTSGQRWHTTLNKPVQTVLGC